MLIIYTPQITNRVSYIFKLVFQVILGVEYKLTNNIQEYTASKECKLNYSKHNVCEGELLFIPAGLLFEMGVKDQDICVINWENTKAFFTTSRRAALPFDPFAATFFMVSRYEEYLPNIRDSHDRFDAHESLAYQHNFLRKPVVNIWAQKIKQLLLEKHPGLYFKEQHYKYISTIDIDNAWAHREKGPMRTLATYAKALFRLDFEEIKEKNNVFMGHQKDPYDTYDYQLEIQKKYNIKPIYFFLMADYDVNDKNIPVESKKFQSLIKSIADYAEVGIHPGYASTQQVEKFEIEIKRLSKILNREITKSRQHFLKITLPDTYRKLIELDITDDYTMGFASEIGFRAGICTPYYFYDIDLEVETKLKLHPFEVMEASLKYYMKVKPQDAISLVKPLIDEVRAVNGTFISLWHNETMSDVKQWAGWKNVYEEVVKEAVEKSETLTKETFFYK